MGNRTGKEERERRKKKKEKKKGKREGKPLLIWEILHFKLSRVLIMVINKYYRKS
ncbi:MAG: hypothetical protein ACFFBP_06995 [Promethearchaeota archaeon]